MATNAGAGIKQAYTQSGKFRLCNWLHFSAPMKNAKQTPFPTMTAESTFKNNPVSMPHIVR